MLVEYKLTIDANYYNHSYDYECYFGISPTRP